MQTTYRSNGYVGVAGGNVNVDMGFIPTFGPSGKPNVIESLTVEIACTITNPGGVTLTARDASSVLADFRLRDIGGLERFNAIRGWDLKNIISRGVYGVAEPPLLGAAGAGVATAIVERFRVPMGLGGQRDGGMYSEDDLHVYAGDLNAKPAECNVRVATVAELLTTGGAATSITLITVTVEAECYELSLARANNKRRAKVMPRWSWQRTPWTAIPSTFIPVDGKPLVAAYVYDGADANREAAGVLTTITNYTIPQLGITLIPPGSFVDAYRATRDRISAANDLPTVVGSVCPLIQPAGASVLGVPAVAGNMQVRCTPGALANAPQTCFMVLEAKSPVMTARALAAAGIDQTKGVTVTGPSGCDPEIFRSRIAYAPEYVEQ